ncbi:MAG TPA: hypothetical protein PLO56_05645 [Rhodothermales bacterium]|nr:hypothetical protein [Rhodothermales bacterium]
MKSLISKVLFVIVLYYLPQSLDAQCGTKPPTSNGYSLLSANSSNIIGGTLDYVPRTGNINALFIFVQFKDDTYQDCRQFTGYNSTTGQPTFSGVMYHTTGHFCKSDDSAVKK